MVDYPQKNAWSLPPARECSCPSWPTRITHAEVCRAMQDGEGGIPAPEPAHGCSRPICRSPSQPQWNRCAGRTRAAAGAAPQRARVPACDEHTVPSHVAAPPRGRKPNFKGREAGGARVSGGGCSPAFVIIQKKSESFRSWECY